MSRQSKRKWCGGWLALLICALGCQGSLVEETPPEASTEPAPKVLAQHETPGADSVSRCRPALMVTRSPDANPFTFYPSPALTPLGERVYFFAPYPEGGPSALWRADAEGARPFRVNVSGPLMKAGALLYFAQNGSLWASDGTTSGTRLLKGLEGAPSAEPSWTSGAGSSSRSRARRVLASISG